MCRWFEGSSVSTGSMCVDGLRGPQLVQAVCVSDLSNQAQMNVTLLEKDGYIFNFRGGKYRNGFS